MKIILRLIDIFLDAFKKTLVRFKNSKFGILFIVNLFKLPDFYKDKSVNIISKYKVTFTILITFVYLLLGIDFIPEVITGIFGFIDDLFVLFWSFGIINEELEMYKKIRKDTINPNIIEGVTFSIKDEE